MKKSVLMVAAAFLIAGLGASLQATPIVGSSSGIFTSSTCTSGCTPNPVNSSVFYWGDSVSASDSSFLKIVPVTFPISGPGTGIDTQFVIGHLLYRNSVDASGSFAPDAIPSLTANLTFVFTDPSGAPNAYKTFIFTGLLSTTNPDNDQIILPTLAGLTFNLGGGYTIDTFTYSVTGAGSLSGLTWTGNENSSSDITAYLESDLQINAVARFSGGGTTTVPEPGSLLLLGTGLIVAGAIRRRMQK